MKATSKLMTDDQRCQSDAAQNKAVLPMPPLGKTAQLVPVGCFPITQKSGLPVSAYFPFESDPTNLMLDILTTPDCSQLETSTMIIKTTVMISIILTVSGLWADDRDQFRNALRDCISQLNNDAKGSADLRQGLNINQRHIITKANPGRTPLADGFETRMSERAEAIQLQVVQQLGDLSEKLSGAIDSMHKKISEDVEELTQKLTPNAEALSRQQDNNTDQLRQTLSPYNKVLKAKQESTEDVRDVLSLFTEQMQQKNIGNAKNRSMTGNDEEIRNKFDQAFQELLNKMIPLIKDSMSKVSQLASEMAQKGCSKY
ncbi:apolipoprotein A-IV-like isoform X2 [Pristis pectinata]|uniref:apolipoprotein A-IV-like isoform X2 n=1 Tax=Pristis pectinata TaxID=685728 RepID=UPI00223E4C32|nr:apolipoprotein A-IV-like isoform X2 [Pristis pectinata]XP_051896040.1 apolipoprotein A-IV-like isoform X2 [Pristis pectinata]XP_051896041.1 apolipoprotein A-IV-like isoform X2 [Pristis pectinata]XP_051896042.1 apolipoprotein A-IV-like isoform X2 [Pristis pectinata]XP_051896043.1 apolipoprotein A-IV-like isoform X2 [Pristis pectinata]XP_051896045.1 apolipoprotein A-IV-like isoform X2 [Pristis pectinata]